MAPKAHWFEEKFGVREQQSPQQSSLVWLFWMPPNSPTRDTAISVLTDAYQELSGNK